MSPVLEMKDLLVEAVNDRGTRLTIVDRIGFSLQPGEVLGLIGESGAGKSTIGLAALGYCRRGLQITGGQILLQGRDLRQMSREERRRIRGAQVAYIAQSAAASFNPAQRILTQVIEVPVRHRLMTPEQARAEALMLFRELDLPDPDNFGDRFPHQVSGGQLQRAMAAMAMAARPKLVVFDEPTTALDVTTQVEVLASFKKLIRDHGTAALYITHDLAVVAQIADRIMVLRHGRQVELGATAQILSAPTQDYTARLVAERQAAAEGRPQPPAGTRPILEVQAVTARYRKTGPAVVNELTLDLRRGETVAVVGESGSGKSSLARLITGLLPAETGAVLLDGVALPAQLRGRDLQIRRRMQLVYQMPDVALNPLQTVLEAVGRPMQLYFGLNRAETRRRVEALMQEMELDPKLILRRTSELSGGQKQRVSIARALAAEPEVVICDEVTSALDQLVADEILKLLQRLQAQRGLAYLFITHDLGVVRRIADRVMVMLKGRAVAFGPLQEIFNPPFDPYTEMLLSSVPEMRTDWLEGVLARRRAPVGG